MFKKPFLIATVALSFVFFPLLASAEKASVVGKVAKIQESLNGDCLIKLDKPIANNNGGALLNCANEWVSFSCTGNFNPKDVAYHKFDLARDAFLKNDYVLTLTIDDAKKEGNGYCFVESVILSKMKP